MQKYGKFIFVLSGIHIFTQLGKYEFPFFMSEEILTTETTEATEATETPKISKSKKRLLISAIQMLSLKLWDDITITDIEKYLNQTRGVVFHHFKTKDELFADALSYLLTQLIESLDQNPYSTLYTIVDFLETEFDIKNPMSGFFLLVGQARYKNIDGAKEVFKYINKMNIMQEQNAIGREFIKLCCSGK